MKKITKTLCLSTSLLVAAIASGAPITPIKTITQKPQPAISLSKLLCSIPNYDRSTNNSNSLGNTPTYEALKASFVKYISKISSKQKQFDKEQQDSTDGLETRPENEYKIAGMKKGYYESNVNSYFGYNVRYVALIDDNITDEKKATALYNDWKILLTKCLNVNSKEDKKADGSAYLSFESAYFKDYDNAHFKLTLRLWKDKNVYNLDFIVNEID